MGGGGVHTGLRPDSALRALSRQQVSFDWAREEVKDAKYAELRMEGVNGGSPGFARSGPRPNRRASTGQVKKLRMEAVPNKGWKMCRVQD